MDHGGSILWVLGLRVVQFLVFMVPHACCVSGRIWHMDAGNGSIFLGSRTLAQLLVYIFLDSLVYVRGLARAFMSCVCGWEVQ